MDNQSLWGITTFFNPEHYNNKHSNYRVFREHSKRQGLNLVTVELAFGNAPFELTQKDADILIQIRGTQKNILWQKERLLHIALSYVPLTCTKIVWLDCDLIFKNDAWIKETSEKLDVFFAVQPFEASVRLKKGLQSIDENTIQFGFLPHQKKYSSAYYKAYFKENDVNFAQSNPGYAWAMRRDKIEKIGFYENMIVGGADVVMVEGIIGINVENHFNLNVKMKEDMSNWIQRSQKELQGNVTYTSGTVLHLWHGSSMNRRYRDRYTILSAYDFDPCQDITIDSQHLLQWATNKPNLHKEVTRYFKLRDEEGAIGLRNIFSMIRNMKYYTHLIIGKVGLYFRSLRRNI
ncbi:MAG: hypothetical protein M3Q63_02490 [bacterium]|nr:hypothetical protein [bacterium]